MPAAGNPGSLKRLAQLVSWYIALPTLGVVMFFALSALQMGSVLSTRGSLVFVAVGTIVLMRPWRD